MLLTACGAHTDHPVGHGGPPPTVHGHLVGIGGPAGSAPRHWAGTVTLTAADGSATTVHTDAQGGFSLAAPSGAGHYTLTGTSPLYDAGVCHGQRAVTVGAHGPVHVDVLCPLR